MSHGAREEAQNRLAQETSPYLLLHQSNPVDWYPWGQEALRRAREEGKPIFLSVGYSTCYWCHVMERESFSDPAVAELMNREFINIKVDREERPDLDDIYMVATQILSGQGGWPNSVFLTPDLKPFYAGTYFPPDERYRRPSFRSVLQGLAEAWRNRRSEVEQQAEEVATTMRRYLEERAQSGDEPAPATVAEASLEGLARSFDPRNGGFGGAPKFPSPSNLFLLMELASREPRAKEMLEVTLDRMARGGIYDQLGGGFHRYSTDGQWRVPHFEKMLYDNGFLLEIYARWHGATGDPEAARIAEETAAFLAREMTSAEGAFLSAIDAETAAMEGAYYVWTGEELRTLLGEEDGAFLAPILGFEGAPFFEGEHYVLHLPEPLEERARARGKSREALLAEIAPLRERLLEARWQRERPLTDDKILADWNGVAIAGMATAGRCLGKPELVERAALAARFVLSEMRPSGGPLLHTWREGQGKLPAFLADYAFLIRGLLALHEATGEASWLETAVELAEEQSARLGDPQGGFFDAAAGDDLLFRSKGIFDGAMPSANGVAALNLVSLAEATGEDRWRQEAEGLLRALGPLVMNHPDALRTVALATSRYHEKGGEAGAPGKPGAEEGLAPLEQEALSRISTHLRLGDESAEGWRPFHLEIQVAPGWHLNAHPASEGFLRPTEILGSGVELRGVVYPEGALWQPEFAQGQIRVYRDRVVVEGELRRGEGASGELVVAFQPCDESRCLPPVERRLKLR
jgi:uncharacterized protein YyaL (SSP411 family)